jgi:hypothetical protein
VAGVTRRPGLAVLVGGLAAALPTGGVVAAVALRSGRDAGLSAAVGAGLAVLALGVGPLLQHACRRLDPVIAMGVAVLAYCAVVAGAGLAYSALNDASWLMGPWAAAGVLLTALAWTVGQMRAVTKVRQLLYDEPEATAGR